MSLVEQSAGSSVTCRRADTNARCQFGIGQPTLRVKCPQDLEIDVVQTCFGRIFHPQTKELTTDAVLSPASTGTQTGLSNLESTFLAIAIKVGVPP